MAAAKVKLFLNMRQFFMLFFYLEQVIFGWEKFNQMQIVYQNKRKIIFITFHCLKRSRIRSYSGPHFPAFGPE